MRVSRKKPAPKWGTTTGTSGNADATGTRASGFPRRMSNRDGRPSLRRTPTDRTPQCTNTTHPRSAAASNTGTTRSSSSTNRASPGRGRRIASRAHRTPADPGAGVGRRRVQHERSGQARRVPGDRFRDRLLVTRDARHDGGARHAVMVKLRHPSIRERGGRTRWIPPECCRQIDGRIAGRRRRRVATERCEETGREEMAVRVVEAGCLRFSHRCGLWRRGGSPSPPVGIVRLIRLDPKNLQSRTIRLQVDATRPGRRRGLV